MLYIPELKAESKKMIIKHPISFDVSKMSSLSCQSLIDVSVFGSYEGIEGEVRKGTDILAIKIKDEKTMLLTTQASVKVGITEPAEFNILQNDSDTLLAVEFHEALLTPSVSTFSLNKKKGLAIWTKNEPSYLLFGRPMGMAMYLTCK